MKVQSNSIVFMDITDTNKIDIHISANQPTVQIYDTNQRKYTPDWEQTPLELRPTVYADGIDVTNKLNGFAWYKIIQNTQTPIPGADKILTVTTNELSSTINAIRYRFHAEYNGKGFDNEISFALTTTGANGYTPQKGIDYFDGENGRDGTSVEIKGVAYSNTIPIPGQTIDLYSDATIQNNTTQIFGAEGGESYLVDGYLCIWNIVDDESFFMCVGKIQGPQGKQGDSYYLYIRYAEDQYGAGMTASPNSKTSYIGFYRTSVQVEPTDPSLITWQKFVGEDAKNITLSASAQVFKINKEGEMSPSKITVTAQADNTSVTSWSYSTDGGRTWVSPPTSVSEENGVVTIDGSLLSENSITIKASDGVHSDVLTVYKIFDGIDGDSPEPTPTVFLTNENISFAANANGQIPETTTIYTNVVAYNGAEKVTPTLGTITASDGKLPEGMSIGTITPQSNEQRIPIIINSNANLGSVKSNNGTIIIPVVSPVNTNLRLSWSKINTGIKGTSAVTFQIYAQNGYLLTIDNPSLTLQALAYEGSAIITSNATFKWYGQIEGEWVVISDATSNSLNVSKTEVLKAKNYKCEMTYKNNVYTATATVEDKTDVYDSLINVVAKYSPTNRLYWVLYSTVYTEEGEQDELLGPVSVAEPINPIAGSYWYKIDETNYNVTLMKYSGTEWTATTDSQALVYDWFLFNDIDDTITLGSQSKVKIVTSNDFSRVCSVQCNISDSNLMPLAHNNQILNDSSDPIVSATEPPNPIDKQLWIKIADNGTYVISIWDAEAERWIVSSADSRNKLHTEKPVQYDAGDVWIVGGDYQPTIYINGVAQTSKYLIGTMLKAQSVSTTYTDSDWVEALNYQEDIDDLKDQLNIYNQHFAFDEGGITMTASNLSGEISEFKTKLTNTELGFYQGENKVAHINNNQLNISKAEITNGLTITGAQYAPPTLSIGGFSLVVESNGSLSIGYNA